MESCDFLDGLAEFMGVTTSMKCLRLPPLWNFLQCTGSRYSGGLSTMWGAICTASNGVQASSMFHQGAYQIALMISFANHSYSGTRSRAPEQLLHMWLGVELMCEIWGGLRRN
jgi:hypothetical protein